MDQLAVVIVNWNRYAETARCVSDLLAWSRTPEIWVVDNGSGDGSARRFEEGFPSVRTIASPLNLGFGGGNNLALARLERPYVLLLNNDAGLDESSAHALCGACEDDPGLAIVGPLVVDAEDRGRVLSAGGRDVSRYISTNLGQLPQNAAIEGQSYYDVEYVPGTAAVIRTAALRQVGLLDPDYFFGGELADLASRLREHGWRCAVVPGAIAWHDRSHAAENRTVLYRYYILRNRFLYIRRRLGGAARLRQLGWLAYGAYSISRFVLRGRFRSARAEALALVDGLLGRYGDRNEKVRGVSVNG